MSPSQSSETVERAVLEVRVRATNYMREWWSHCAKIEREHRTGIAWLADHVLHVAGVPDLLAKVDELTETIESHAAQCDAGKQRIAELERAITEHRTAIRNAGPIRVDSRDVPVADAKQKADERLWGALR